MKAISQYLVGLDTTVMNPKSYYSTVTLSPLNLSQPKLLVISNFSYSHNVFKRLVSHARKSQGLFGKGLTPYQLSKFKPSPNWKHLQTIKGTSNR